MHPLFGILGGAALTLAACLGTGRAAWRRAPHWTLQLAAGAALLGTVLFALLALRWAQAAVIVPLCVAASVPLLPAIRNSVKPRLPEWLALPAAAYGAYYLAHALAPEIQPDAAGYHLGLVADWARQGGMTARTGFYDLLPLGLETLFYPAFLIGGHSAAKLVHFGFFASTVPLIAWIGRTLGADSRAAFCAGGLYFLTPVAGISGTSAYNDAAAAFFPLAAFGILLSAGQERRLYFHAGLAAGFAYAVKTPGAAAAAGALAWAAWRGGRRAAMLCCAGAALCAGPWLARNAVLTGNPAAPLGNRVFPNDHFHAQSEENLARNLSSYGGTTPAQALHALAIDGTRLQGLIGPALFLLPLGLLAARTAQGRIVLAAGLLLLLPWTRNLGARFLMPSLPFLFLAAAMALPARLMAALLLLQAAACAPGVVDRYAGEHAWRLRGFPWRAALRLEREEDYLRRHLYEYSFAEKAAARTGADGVLDLYGLPSAYLPAVPLGPLSSAALDNAAIALIEAAGKPERIAVVEARLGGRFYRAFRVSLAMDWPGMWSIQEARLEWRGREVSISPQWVLDAYPNPGDAWLALDRNPATRWRTWDDSRAGAWWQVTFTRPRPADALILHVPDAAPRPPVALHALTPSGRWEDLSARLERVSVQRMAWRRKAVLHLYGMGIRWIAAPVDELSYAVVGRSLRDAPATWGVTPALVEKGLGLFRIEPPRQSR